MSRNRKFEVEYDVEGLASCVECGRIVVAMRYLGDDSARVFSINTDAIEWLGLHVPGWPNMEIRQGVSVRAGSGAEYHRVTCPGLIVMNQQHATDANRKTTALPASQGPVETSGDLKP